MPPKASGRTNQSTHHSHHFMRSNMGTRSKSPSDAPPIPADPGNTDLSSSSYDAASLHFHGLAFTQTQTQIASSTETSAEGGTRSDSRATKKRKVSHDPHVCPSPKAPSKSSNQNQLSETKPASHSASRLKRRRSSLSSADSFAADEWEDPEKVFLASNRQFEVPLSELGRGAMQREVQEVHHLMAGTPSRPIAHEPTQLDTSLSLATEGVPASGSNVPKVQRPGLQSDDALSQVSDMSTGAQGPNRSPISEFPDDVSTPPVVSNPGSMDHLDVPPEDYQATQPLASQDLDIDLDAISPLPRKTSPHAWSSTTSRPSTNRSNILSMVNPEKKWRIQRGKQLLQAALESGSDGQTQPLTDLSRSSHAPNTGRMPFDQMAAQKRAERQSSPPHGLEGQKYTFLPSLDEDSREIAVVPDSEPPDPANTSSRPHLEAAPKDSLHDGRVDSPPSLHSSVTSMVVEKEISRNDKEKEGQTDDSDEADVPLLLTVPRPYTSTGPPSSKASNPHKVSYPSNLHVHTRPRETTVEAIRTKASNTRRFHPRDKELLSSVPGHDHRPSTLPPTPPRTGRSNKHKEVDISGEEAFTPTDEVTHTPDEGSTEPADDLPMDLEDNATCPPDSKVPTSRKRIALAPPPVRKSAYRAAVRVTSNTPSLISGTRPTKRAKARHPTATSVFALWKDDAAYFSGFVRERVGQSDRFKIQFDDGDEDVVDVKNLRRLEFRIGDRVSVIESQEKATIANVDRQEQGTVIVRLNDDPATLLEVKVLGIKVQNRAIGTQWGDRTIVADEIKTLVPRTKSETPSSLLRNSSSGLGKKKILTKVGIVVTLSVGCDREKEKEIIMRIIRTNGGTVLDDWSDIFSLAGEYFMKKKRWVITSDNIGTESKHDIQQVFLVSDAANTKPRFLTALALGIPCLSVEWLRGLSSGQCAVSDWPSYLLPAGYSDSLGARVSQLVDLDWGSTLDHLTSIMSNNVATKLFSDQSVLVLGPEYFPPPAKGKKNTSGVGEEKFNDGGRFIPRIIVSMGAARVEAVPELKYSSNPDLKEFQYVVVKDMHERPSIGGEKYVSMEWVKDCLIAGRMFPPRV